MNIEIRQEHCTGIPSYATKDVYRILRKTRHRKEPLLKMLPSIASYSFPGNVGDTIEITSLGFDTLYLAVDGDGTLSPIAEKENQS